ncbi:hypothetical protein BGZ98_007345 [Dissophora globulifera]|nr:hypothetical protein BGZ98_007345 [Dissophora globulifera]
MKTDLALPSNSIAELKKRQHRTLDSDDSKANAPEIKDDSQTESILDSGGFEIEHRPLLEGNSRSTVMPDRVCTYEGFYRNTPQRAGTEEDPNLSRSEQTLHVPLSNTWCGLEILGIHKSRPGLGLMSLEFKYKILETMSSSPSNPQMTLLDPVRRLSSIGLNASQDDHSLMKRQCFSLSLPSQLYLNKPHGELTLMGARPNKVPLNAKLLGSRSKVDSEGFEPHPQDPLQQKYMNLGTIPIQAADDQYSAKPTGARTPLATSLESITDTPPAQLVAPSGWTTASVDIPTQILSPSEADKDAAAIKPLQKSSHSHRPPPVILGGVDALNSSMIPPKAVTDPMHPPHFKHDHSHARNTNDNKKRHLPISVTQDYSLGQLEDLHEQSGGHTDRSASSHETERDHVTTVREKEVEHHVHRLASTLFPEEITDYPCEDTSKHENSPHRRENPAHSVSTTDIVKLPRQDKGTTTCIESKGGAPDFTASRLSKGGEGYRHRRHSFSGATFKSKPSLTFLQKKYPDYLRCEISRYENSAQSDSVMDTITPTSIHTSGVMLAPVLTDPVSTNAMSTTSTDSPYGDNHDPMPELLEGETMIIVKEVIITEEYFDLNEYEYGSNPDSTSQCEYALAH